MQCKDNERKSQRSFERRNDTIVVKCVGSLCQAMQNGQNDTGKKLSQQQYQYKNDRRRDKVGYGRIEYRISQPRVFRIQRRNERLNAPSDILIESVDKVEAFLIDRFKYVFGGIMIGTHERFLFAIFSQLFVTL
jgi:hypothetical protein